MLSNLLSPLSFSDSEVLLFLRDQRCSECVAAGQHGHLQAFRNPEDSWRVECLEHGPIYEHNHIDHYRAEQVKQNELVGKLELRILDEPRKPSDILKELGFGG